MTTSGEYLVADIGASNARFRLAGPHAWCGDTVRLNTGDFAASGALLEAALDALGRPVLQRACLAVAGPVRGGRGRLTNGTLEFHGNGAERHLGCGVLVINDFHAMARSLPQLEALQPIGGAGEPAAEGGLKAVLGPGSGLGMGLLAGHPGGWQVLESQGGHADLAPGNPLEAELLSVLQAAHGHVSWETVLCGPGLVRLYHAVCQLWGMPPDDLDAERITALGLHAEEPVCHQTLEVFFAFLGAAAGNLALTAWALGGVYVGGGIVPAMPDFAAHSPLRRRFDERGPMTDAVREIPLYLILDPAPGLVGALACLYDQLGAVR